MKPLRAMLGLTVLCLALPGVMAREAAAAAQRADGRARRCPRRPDLPALPERSPRNANYTIQARLDAERHRHRRPPRPGVAEHDRRSRNRPFPFHLYWNAFRNNLSTSARGAGPAGRPRPTIRGAGDTRTCSRIAAAGDGAAEADLTPTIRYVQPDDANADDRTVMEVTTPSPVPADATVRFRVDWQSLIPHGALGRAGWVHDYHFIAQWFPKIGVFWKGAWNAHQFHPTTEFFSDFGVYDVALTLPAGYVVGATGALRETRDEPDGMRARSASTRRTSTTSPGRRAGASSRRPARFEAAGYPPVDIRLLVQPEHAHLSERYIEATRVALKGYGAWSAPYPYAQITVVDPAWGSGSGGMEYPTLITGGAEPVGAARAVQPGERHHPRGRPSVLVRPRRHQRVRGAVARRGLQPLPRPQGLQPRVRPRAAGASATSASPAARSAAGRWWPPGSTSAAARTSAAASASTAATDVMARRSWDFEDPDSYGLNAYGKPALSLQTLEGLVGDETMTRILRTYARRYRFAHPTERGLHRHRERGHRPGLALVLRPDVVLGRRVRLRGAGEERARADAAGLRRRAVGTRARLAAPRDDDEKKDDARPYESEVTVLRLGGVRLPVEVRSSSRTAGRCARPGTDSTAGRASATAGRRKVVAAVVDPEGRIALDVNPANNGWAEENGPGARARPPSGRRAGCSGSSTCSRCTRCSDEDGGGGDRRRAAAGAPLVGPVRPPPRPSTWPRR